MPVLRKLGRQKKLVALVLAVTLLWPALNGFDHSKGQNQLAGDSPNRVVVVADGGSGGNPPGTP